MKRNAMAGAALLISFAALVSSRWPARPLPAGQEIPQSGQKAAHELSTAFNAVAEFIRPSVVQINVEKQIPSGRMGVQPGRGGDSRQLDPEEMDELLRRYRGFFDEARPEGQGQRPPMGGFHFDRQQSAVGTGSGFVYDDKGHILTNNHVVEGAEKIQVTFHDGTTREGKVLGTFAEADVAVVQVEDASGYPPVQIATLNKLKVGDWVLAVGSPFGLSQTVTAGIISATERDNLGINRFESFIQTDASINRGNSGGPLVDMSGRVVGINSAIATATGSNAGVGFAIPIDMAKRIADKLIQKGKLEKALMGVGLDTLGPGLARQFGLEPKTHGVVVMSVGPNTPAEKAGLKVGDIITSFDGLPVRSREGLTYLVQTSDSGKQYRVTYLRDGQPYDTQVTPEPRERWERAVENSRARPERRAVTPEAHQNVSDYGLAVTPLTPELAKRYGYEGQFAFDSGLVVAEVKPGSPAAEAGMEKGDLITKFVKDRMIHDAKSVEEFQQLIESHDEIAVWLEDVNHKLPGEFKTLEKPKAEKK